MWGGITLHYLYMKYLFTILSLLLLLSSCGKTVEVEEKIVEKIVEVPFVGPGMIHSVFFWLKPDVTEAERATLLAELEKLKEIETVQRAFIGPPSATEERGVVDNTYSYAFIVWFADVEAQNAYQIDPIHLAFVEKNKDLWTKVVVYDNDVMQ